MDKLKDQVKLKWWPSLQDYNEAIQNPHVNLQDAELKAGVPYSTPLGLPRAVTGSFASVYRMHCGHKDYALRLFLKNIEDQSERYACISHFVQHDSLPYTVTFDFLAKGIKMRGDWMPALKMEWVDGEAFDEYIIDNLSNPKVLQDLSKKFLNMMVALRKAGIAHGDLQHGNIIIFNREIRLVDYDGMFVPAMKGMTAGECGHRNYQHPGRAANHFGPYLDNFSAWVIYASLRALEVDPKLLNKLGGGDDCLLFRQQDFTEPTRSPAFAAFETHENADLKLLGRFIRAQLDKDVAKVPYLQWPIPKKDSPEIAPLSESTKTIRGGPRLVRPGLPEWLQLDNLEELSRHGSTKQGKEPGIVYAKPAQASSWVKPEIKKTDSLDPRKFPHELVVSQVPRAVTYNTKHQALSGWSPPSTHQSWMLLNPLVYVMVFYLFTGLVTDREMCEHAVAYPATVEKISFHPEYYKGRLETRAKVEFKFTANGNTYFIEKPSVWDLGDYSVGKVYPVWALPSNPGIHLPVGQSPIVERANKLLTALSCLTFNFILECLIWFRPLLHRRLARVGVPVLATVISRDMNSKAITYSCVVRFDLNGKRITQTINLSPMEYTVIRVGEEDVVLVDPTFPSNIVLYRFCMYQPCISTTP